MSFQEKFKAIEAAARERLKDGNCVLTEIEIRQIARDDSWPVFVEINVEGHVGNWVYPRELRKASKADYEKMGKTWRAWIAPPDDDERAAIKWEETDGYCR